MEEAKFRMAMLIFRTYTIKYSNHIFRKRRISDESFDQKKMINLDEMKPCFVFSPLNEMFCKNYSYGQEHKVSCFSYDQMKIMGRIYSVILDSLFLLFQKKDNKKENKHLLDGITYFYPITNLIVNNIDV